VREYWQVDPQVARYSERPKLWDAISGLSDEVWPEYNQHGHTLNHYWAQIYDVFREWQFVLYDPGDQAVLAQGHTVPLAWDRTDAGLRSARRPSHRGTARQGRPAEATDRDGPS
jgi:hypothetical protein